MILVIGGAFQGKHDFAMANFPGMEIRELDEDGDITGGDIVLISTEIGSGIVPLDALERERREQTGSLQIRAAKAADEVYRVVAGIGVRIK